jgi:hypothetical protein
MPKQELAFVKVTTNIKLCAVPKANTTSASELQRESNVGSEAQTFPDSLQLHVSKRKAKELSISDSPSETARCIPTLGHLFDDRPAVQSTTGELAAQVILQTGTAEGGIA